jgi:hypothetical protein
MAETHQLPVNRRQPSKARNSINRLQPDIGLSKQFLSTHVKYTNTYKTRIYIKWLEERAKHPAADRSRQSNCELCTKRESRVQHWASVRGATG